MGALEIVGSLFLLAGCVFALTGALGVLRMPDFYSRLHPAGKTDSFAVGLIVIGLSCFALQDLLPSGEPGEQHELMATVGTVDIVLKLVLLIALILLTSPTATHAISKAARLDHHTKIHVDGDPAESRVSDIVVAGDVHAPIEEQPNPVFDVEHDDEPQPPASEADQPSEPAEREEP